MVANCLWPPGLEEAHRAHRAAARECSKDAALNSAATALSDAIYGCASGHRGLQPGALKPAPCPSFPERRSNRSLAASAQGGYRAHGAKSLSSGLASITGVTAK